MIHKDLRAIIEQSWNKNTSQWPGVWKSDNPASGQGSVTALLVQDYVGGVIVRGNVRGPLCSGQHYWNRVQGETVDLTFGQFPDGTRITGDGIPVERDKLLEDESTADRYWTLKDIVDEGIEEALVGSSK
jgi:hypothetical protein